MNGRLGLLRAAMALGGSALAASAVHAQSAPVATDPTADQISAWIAEDNAAPQSLSVAPDGVSPVAPERRIHGEVGATISNRGYGGYAAVQMPVGQASEVDVAVAGEHVDRYGPWRGGNRQSLALAIRLDGGDVARFLSREKCNVPRWGVRLPTDPVVLPDGRCLKPEPTADSDRPRRRGPSGGQAQPGAFGPGG